MPVIPKNLVKSFHKGAILVFREKHGTRYFDASTLAAAGKACRKILKERHGVYWDKKPREDLAVVSPSFSRREVEALHDGLVKSAAIQEWKKYEAAVKNNKAHIAFITKVETALKNDDDYAVSLVFERRDYEYEGVEVDYLENIP